MIVSCVGCLRGKSNQVVPSVYAPTSNINININNSIMIVGVFYLKVVPSPIFVVNQRVPW